MKNFYLERIFNLETVEAYFLRDKYLAKPRYCMILIDYRRASTLDDFPELKGIEKEDDFGRANFIKAVILSREELDETSEEVLEVPSGFLENKPDCHWRAEFEIVPNFPEERGKLLNLIHALLQKHDYFIDVTNIPEYKLNYLSQK
ncbi:hypothetical protein [Brevibacillus sp. 179-C9.3 HS]|uniref:hypothetical protein n=1 Tax=unclassified Brevibacillus TaxID=2684853 RepID=UPI0039A10274